MKKKSSTRRFLDPVGRWTGNAFLFEAGLNGAIFHGAARQLTGRSIYMLLYICMISIHNMYNILCHYICMGSLYQGLWSKVYSTVSDCISICMHNAPLYMQGCKSGFAKKSEN